MCCERTISKSLRRSPQELCFIFFHIFIFRSCDLDFESQAVQIPNNKEVVSAGVSVVLSSAPPFHDYRRTLLTRLWNKASEPMGWTIATPTLSSTVCKGQSLSAIRTMTIRGHDRNRRNRLFCRGHWVRPTRPLFFRHISPSHDRLLFRRVSPTCATLICYGHFLFENCRERAYSRNIPACDSFSFSISSGVKIQRRFDCITLRFSGYEEFPSIKSFIHPHSYVQIESLNFII